MARLQLILEPGSLSLLVVAVAAGAVASRFGGIWARRARIWLAAWCGIYLLLSLPVVTVGLLAGLVSAQPSIRTPAEAAGRRAVVLLSGSARVYRIGDERVAMLDVVTALRAMEAARVYRLLDAPFVIVTGAGSAGEQTPMVQAMRAHLLAAGVPPEAIVLESASRDTRESARAVRALLRARGIAGAVMVTSAHHVPRALGAFRAEGVDVIASASPLVPARWGGGWSAFVPHADALPLSAYCLHEYVGLAYYRLRGWL